MAVIVTLFFGSVGLLSSTGGGLSSRWPGKQKELAIVAGGGHMKPSSTLNSVESEWDPLTVLNGLPTARFPGEFGSVNTRNSSDPHGVLVDNLRKGQKYITTFLSAGWSACYFL